MAATVSYNSANRAVERDCSRLYFKVAFSAVADGTEDGTLVALPAGTTILDAGITCSVAATGTGTETASLRLSTTGAIYAGTSDNGGTVNVRDVLEFATREVSAAETLTLRNTHAGGAGTTAATYLVWVDVLRTSF